MTLTVTLKTIILLDHLVSSSFFDLALFCLSLFLFASVFLSLRCQSHDLQTLRCKSAVGRVRYCDELRRHMLLDLKTLTDTIHYYLDSI